MSAHRRMRFAAWLSLIVIVAVIMAGCAAPATPTPAQAPTKAAQVEPTKAPTKAAEPTKAPSGPGEAPMLAELVKAGKLPPVEQRLPAEPLVFRPEVSVGKYGGRLRTPHQWDIYFELSLLQKTHDNRDVWQPMVAKAYKFSDDYKSITFYLRPGMKWSDGKPYTADDIMFWWNDIVKSKYNLQPGVAGMNVVAGDNLVKVDDYTIRFEFVEPRPRFVDQSRGGYSYGFYGYPAHYFKQLHPAYNNTPADKAQEAFDKLQDRLYQNKWMTNDPNAPTICAFKPVEFKEGQYALWERNPYFFGVDTQGNQLPYIDSVECLAKTDKDAEFIKVKLLAGEADMVFRTIGIADYPLLKEKEKQIGLQILLFDDITNGKQVFHINQEYAGQEKAVADLLRNVDFRRALSLALDRELMNESIYQGLGTPGHGFSRQGVYDEKIDGAYAKRDLPKANQLLDSLGLSKRDSENFRTLPDGSKLTLEILFQAGWGYGANQTIEFAVDNWQEVGLRVVGKPVEGKVFSERISANDWEVKLHPGFGGWEGYATTYYTVNVVASLEYRWVRTGGKEGQEPQGKLKEFLAAYYKAINSPDKAEIATLLAQIRATLAEELWIIGTVSNVPSIMAINAKLRNVPGQTARTAIGQGESEYLRFEQIYIEQ